jgi:2-oxoglutarate ferredoxin oxidoreductase subunit beta
VSAPEELKLTRKDFTSDQDVRWCPGCGDYAILAQMQKVMPELGVPRENIVFVSGIGCAARFPYYMDTYGFHTIHGRAPAIATGLKLANPDLSVWVITGDGDALSIGGNHLIHALRRNVDIKIVLFNNKVYGLTKGQFSPTSDVGQVTKTSPHGSIAPPFSAPLLAIGSGATFLARSVDTDIQHLQEMLRRMAEHKGSAILEIYQNCVVFNDGAFGDLKDRKSKAEKLLYLEDGEPLVYGSDSEKVLKLDAKHMRLYPGLREEEDGGVEVFHQESSDDATLATLLARHMPEGFPTPVGVFRSVSAPTFDGRTREIAAEQIENRGVGTLEEILQAGDRWTV